MLKTFLLEILKAIIKLLKNLFINLIHIVPIKCPGAPQKVLFLSEELARKKGVRSNSKFSFYCAKGVTFVVKKYSDVLDTLHS